MFHGHSALRMHRPPFQGLLIRPELLCVGFGNVLALWCVWRGTNSASWTRNHLWLLLAGFLVGLATLEKLPGVSYLGLCYGWCWLAALSTPHQPKAESTPPPFWGSLLPAAGGAAVFVLLLQLREFHETLGPVVTTRLRLAGLAVALFPLLGLWSRPWPRCGFVQERARELLLLGGGFLASLLVAYLLVRVVMSHAHAADYFSSALSFVIDPAPHMRDLLDTKAETGGLFAAFVNRGPVPLVAATAVALALIFVRAVQLRLTAFVALLWVGAVGMIVIMSKRHYSAQYDVLSQVPLLLALSIGLSTLATVSFGRPWIKVRAWVVPSIVTMAFALVLTSSSRLRPIYYHYQNDVDPLNPFTLTFLFDHDAHPAAYLKMMREHYGDRAQFAAALEHYLADPAHRY